MLTLNNLGMDNIQQQEPEFDLYNEMLNMEFTTEDASQVVFNDNPDADEINKDRYDDLEKYLNEDGFIYAPSAAMKMEVWKR